MVRVTRGSFDQLCVLSLYCSISMASNGEALAGVAAGRQGSPDAEIANLGPPPAANHSGGLRTTLAWLAWLRGWLFLPPVVTRDYCKIVPIA